MRRPTPKNGRSFPALPGNRPKKSSFCAKELFFRLIGRSFPALVILKYVSPLFLPIIIIRIVNDYM